MDARDKRHPIYAALDPLIDAWCERRDLGPLATLLPPYIWNMGLTDGWEDLLRALRHLRWAYELPDDERDVIYRVVVELENMVYRR